MLVMTRQWFVRLQVRVLAWIATHILEPVPTVHARPVGLPRWRATYWEHGGRYTVQFYRNGECVASGTDPVPHRAYQRARRSARAALVEHGLRRRRV